MELTFLVIFTLAFALACAKDDAEDIAAHFKINHVAQWLFRAVIVLTASAMLGVPCMAIGLAFLFSAVFRFMLNKLRGLGWWWMGPSLARRPKHDSYYDALFHWAAYLFGVYRLNGPGIIAYCVELCIFGVVLYLHL